MISIDTNILVRTIVNDDPGQSHAAQALLLKHAQDGGVRILLIVLVETVWVLKKRYKKSKDEILDFLETLQDIPGVILEKRSAVVQASKDWRRGSVDFTDYIILTVSQEDGCDTTYTFEKRRMGADARATTLKASS